MSKKACCVMVESQESKASITVDVEVVYCKSAATTLCMANLNIPALSHLYLAAISLARGTARFAFSPATPQHSKRLFNRFVVPGITWIDFVLCWYSYIPEVPAGRPVDCGPVLARFS